MKKVVLAIGIVFVMMFAFVVWQKINQKKVDVQKNSMQNAVKELEEQAKNSLKKNNQKRRRRSVSGDFDGDGQMDYIRVVPRANGEKILQKFLEDGSRQNLKILHLEEPLRITWNAIVSKLKKGSVFVPQKINAKTGEKMGNYNEKKVTIERDSIVIGADKSHGGGVLTHHGDHYVFHAKEIFIN